MYRYSLLVFALLVTGCVERRPLIIKNGLPFPIRVEVNGLIGAARVDAGSTFKSDSKFTVRPINHIAVIKLPDGRPPILTAEFSKEETHTRWYDGTRITIEITPTDLPASSEVANQPHSANGTVD